MEKKRSDLVLTCAAGYAAAQVEPFLKSLRATGYGGRIVVLVHGLPREAERLYRSYGAELLRVQRFAALFCGKDYLAIMLRRFRWIAANYARWFNPLPEAEAAALAGRIGAVFHHISSTRYFYYYLFLQKRLGEFRNVMTSDVRDVYFQSDPFVGEWPAPLNFFLEAEGKTIATEPYNATWIRELYGEAVLAKMGGERISCSGITLGRAEAMLGYLRALTLELARINGRIGTRHGYDQGAHNYLLWKGTFGGGALLENGNPLVLTMGEEPRDAFSLGDPEPRVAFAGAEPAVLHQYDRHADIEDRLLAA